MLKLLKEYEVIFSTESLKVLRHKLFAEAKTREWDELATADKSVRFVMGTEGQQTEGDEHLVTPGRRYRPGGYGWDTLSPREAFEDGVGDFEDAAFRIDLPNGKYRVRCRFRSGANTPPRRAGCCRCCAAPAISKRARSGPSKFRKT